MTDARIPDHCAWAARGHWSRAYDAAEAEIARLRAALSEAQFERDNNRAKLEVAKCERDTARAETAAAYEAAADHCWNKRDLLADAEKKQVEAGLTGRDYYGRRLEAELLSRSIRALTPAHATAALAARDKATRKQALREAADLPPYDWDGEPANTFENYVFVKRDNIIALIGK